MKYFLVDENGYTQINHSTIERGLYLSPSDISEAIKADPDTATYAFSTLKIRDSIETRSLEHGDPMITKGEGKGIRILHHEEAAEYLWSRFQSTLRALQRVNLKHTRISREAFTEAEKEILEHHQRVVSQTTSQALNTAKKLGAPVDQPSQLKWETP